MTNSKIDIGWVDPGYVSSRFALDIASHAADMQYFEALGGLHATVGMSLLALGRNLTTQAFLDGDSEWLWCVDTDLVFDKGHWLKLLNMAEETGADMVTGLTFIFKDGVLTPSLFYPFPEQKSIRLSPDLPENGAEVAACGMASVLINRRVFEGMQAPRHPDYRWFDQIVGEAGIMSGEDTQFFMRARENGFTLRVNTDAETWHLKTIGLGKGDFLKQKELWNAGNTTE